MTNHLSYMRRNGGFTIVELLVAVTVFVVLVSIISNVFVTAFRSQQAMVSLMAANDSAGIALEQLAREVRTGSGFCVPASVLPFPCQGAAEGQLLRFVNANDQQVVYRFNDTSESIERSEDGGLTFFPITGTSVRIERTSFFLAHTALAGTWPPRITIDIRVGAKSAFLQGFATDIQTTISSRDI